MFGISAFAQSAYAALGINNYAVSVTENSGIADANTTQAAYLLSKSEANTMNDFNSEAGLFAFVIT